MSWTGSTVKCEPDEFRQFVPAMISDWVYSLIFPYGPRQNKEKNEMVVIIIFFLRR